MGWANLKKKFIKKKLKTVSLLDNCYHPRKNKDEKNWIKMNEKYCWSGKWWYFEIKIKKKTYNEKNVCFMRFTSSFQKKKSSCA